SVTETSGCDKFIRTRRIPRRPWHGPRHDRGSRSGDGARATRPTPSKSPPWPPHHRERHTIWFTSRFDDPIRGDARSPSRSRWRRRPEARRASPVPVVEALEARSLLSLLIVTSGADAGPGSLREVIASSGKGDTIEFAGNVHNITLTRGALQISRDLD